MGSELEELEDPSAAKIFKSLEGLKVKAPKRSTVKAATVAQPSSDWRMKIFKSPADRNLPAREKPRHRSKKGVLEELAREDAADAADAADAVEVARENVEDAKSAGEKEIQA